MSNSIIMWDNIAWAAGSFVAAVIAGLLTHRIVYAILSRITKGATNRIDESLVRHSKKPAQLLLPLIGVILITPVLRVPPEFRAAMNHVIGLFIVGSIAWLSIAMTGVFSDMIAAKYDVSVKDNLTARRVQTQVHVLRRILVVVIVVISVSVMLMTFPEIRSIGAGLFASAGIAGLVIGMAARPALSNLIAGIQMALTEPIRLDDVVIVEGEWGWIEEIGTTYVVVRIWDLRRLVVPLSYFIEKPFQNWTRRSADLLGTVFIYTDYTVPVDEIRTELHAALQSSSRWDGKVWGLQVTNASEQTLELRALMSARDSSTAWDLRCEIREKMIGFLQEKYPSSLPKVRAEFRQDTRNGEPQHESRGPS